MILVGRLPTAEEFVALRRSVGWSSPPLEDCIVALQGSLACVCAVEADVCVGMGRLIGDGRMYCLAVDVVVDPAFQGRGVGRSIMERLKAVATEQRLGTRLDLVAAAEVVPFYRRLGYESLASELMRSSLG